MQFVLPLNSPDIINGVLLELDRLALLQCGRSGNGFIVLARKARLQIRNCFPRRHHQVEVILQATDSVTEFIRQ